MWNKIWQSICLLIVGLCVGILTGLSISPVVQTILSSIIGVVITAASLLIGLSAEWEKLFLKSESKTSLNIFPLTVLIVGITAGAVTGIYLRTHDILEKSSAQISGSLRSTESPGKNGKPDDNLQLRRHLGVLFEDISDSLPLKEKVCETVQQFSGHQLIEQLHDFGNKKINALIDSCKFDPETVGKELSLLCQTN